MAGVIGGVGAAIGGIGSLFGGHGGGGKSGPAWHFSNDQMNQLGQQYLGDINAVQPYALNYAGYAIPQFEQLTSQIQNNPYQGQAQGVAGMEQGLGLGSIMPGQLQGMSNLYGMGNMAAGYAPQLMNTAFDPQNALYNRTYQQTMDQQNAINAMYGVSGSPYGAGVAGQTSSNFNIDWQNAQLQRQLAGIQGLGGMVNDVGRSYAGASDLGLGALNTLTTSGYAPYNQWTANANNSLAALGLMNQGVTGAFGPTNAVETGIGNLMGISQSGQSNAFNQSQTMGQNLGQSLAMLGPSLSNAWSGINQLFAPSSGYAGTGSQYASDLPGGIFSGY